MRLEQRSSADQRRQDFLIETLQGIHTVKAMAMEALMLRRYERLQAQSAASVYEVSRINSVVSGLGATFSQIVMISFVGIGSIYVVSGDLTIGALLQEQCFREESSACVKSNGFMDTIASCKYCRR